MSKDQSENTNHLKDKTKHQKEEDEIEETPDISASIEKKGSYSTSTSDKARTHKGPIGIDRDPDGI